MFSRVIAVLTILGASSVLAQTAIGGNVTGSFEGFQGGIPVVRYDVKLTCSLICPPAMPLLSYRIRGNMQTVFDKAPTENTGLMNAVDATDIERDGESTATTTLVRPGTTNVLIAKGVTCECGTMVNQGGVVDMISPPFSVPPNLVVPDSVRAKSMLSINLTAEPRGNDVVKVIMSGAGIDEVVNLGEFDFPGRGAVLLRTPTVPGMVTISASIGGAAVMRTVTVTQATMTGGGGGSSSGTGGGTGGGSSEPLGCSSAPGIGLLAVGAMLLRRRLTQR